MNRRVWILLLLAGVTLFDRGLVIYQSFFDTTRSQAPPFSYRIEDKYLTVDSIPEKDSSGQPNPVYHAGLQVNDRILEAYSIRGQGKRIQSLFDFGSALRNSYKDEPWILVVQRPGGPQDLGLIIPPQPAPNMETPDTFLLMSINLILPFLLIGAGFFMGFSRPDNNHAFTASLLFLSIGTLVSSSSTVHSYPAGIREFSLFFQLAQSSFASYLFLRLFLLFPSPSPVEEKFPRLKSILLIFAIAGFAHTLSLEFTKSVSFERYRSLSDSLAITQQIFPVVNLMMVLVGLISLFLNKRRTPVQDEKRRINILLAGILCGAVILADAAVYKFLGFRGTYWWLIVLVFFSAAFFPLSFVYAVLKYRVLGMRVIIRRGLYYLIASRGSFILGATLIFIALYLTVGATTFELQVLATPGFGWRLAVLAALAFTLAMTLPQINRRVLPYLDRKFFSEAYDSHRILGNLSRSIQRQPIKPELLIDLAITQINRALNVDRVAVFLRGAQIVDADPDETPESSISWLRKAPDFQCCEIRVESESETQRILAAEPLQDLLLSADSSVVKELEESMGEPQALEIYWDDPDSWIHKWARSDSPTDLEDHERRILQQLNARLIVPMVTNKQLIGFLSLGEKQSEEPYPREEKESLLDAARQMALAIEYSVLTDRMAEQEKLRREIEIAKQVQGQLFPQKIPEMKTLDYIGTCRAAREVGGDYYDFLEIGPGRLGFVVADISGKGISAALLMASLQALLRSHAHLHGDRAEVLVWDINRLMYSSTANGKYASLFYGFYDELSRLLAYVNAGHLPPILYRKDGSVVRLRTGGMVVGMMPDSTYRQEIVALQPGDILLVFSDGITEAMNEKDQEFGEERLLALISSVADLPAASISDTILNQITDYVGTASQHDDSTLVVIKVL